MNLTRHIRTMHEPEKHKKCPCCEFTASRPVNWALHIDNHHPEHGEKKYICDKCPKTFFFEEIFKAHQKSHPKAPKESIECSACNKTFQNTKFERELSQFFFIIASNNC